MTAAPAPAGSSGTSPTPPRSPAKGRPYVYEIVDDTPGQVSALVFTSYGKAVLLTVPDAINPS